MWRSFVDEAPTSQHTVASTYSILKPSFDVLPLSVKQCFVSFALFPEDTRVHADVLLSLWSSWELLPGKHACDAARSYLQMLQDASLIQYSEDSWGNGQFHMHDVLRDLACDIARDKLPYFGVSVFINVRIFHWKGLHSQNMMCPLVCEILYSGRFGT